MLHTRITRHRRSWIFLFALAALTVVFSACSGRPGTQTSSAPSSPAVTATPAPKGSIPSSLPTLMVMAMDYNFKIPATVNAGLMVVNFMNDGKEPHELSFVRLNDGVTVQQFKTALEKDPASSFALTRWHGGIATIMPGQSQRAVINLDPGQYVLSCFVESPNGLPHFMEGMFAPFKVVANASANQTIEPTADGEVIIKNFSFTLPDLYPGTMILKVTNQDPMAHEMNLLKLADGKTMQDVMTFLRKKKGPPPLNEASYGPAPYTYAGSLQPIENGMSNWVEVHLTPGNYVAMCFIPDPHTHLSHVEEGMIKQFTVQ
jgi:hypothetical protein